MTAYVYDNKNATAYTRDNKNTTSYDYDTLQSITNSATGGTPIGLLLTLTTSIAGTRTVYVYDNKN